MAQTKTKTTKSKNNETTHETKLDLKAAARTELAQMLNQFVADNSDLYSQVKTAHWNVKGRHFHSLHKLFDEVAELVEPFTDMMAERASLMGAYVTGTVRKAAEASRLPEFPVNEDGGRELLEAVRDRLVAHVTNLREAASRAGDLEDPTSEDLFAEATRAVDQSIYFVESHLQGKDAEA